jgi:hypothetical protein
MTHAILSREERYAAKIILSDNQIVNDQWTRRRDEAEETMKERDKDDILKLIRDLKEYGKTSNYHGTIEIYRINRSYEIKQKYNYDEGNGEIIGTYMQLVETPYYEEFDKYKF